MRGGKGFKEVGSPGMGYEKETLIGAIWRVGIENEIHRQMKELAHNPNISSRAKVNEALELREQMAALNWYRLKLILAVGAISSGGCWQIMELVHRISGR